MGNDVSNAVSIWMPKCVRINAWPPNVTLHELIDKRLQFVFFEIKYKGSWESTLDYVETVDIFSDGLIRFVNNLEEANQSNPVLLNAHRSLNPELFPWGAKKGKLLPQCVELLARFTNEALLPGDERDPTLDPPSDTVCVDAKCGKYRSILEVAHLEILRK